MSQVMYGKTCEKCGVPNSLYIPFQSLWGGSNGFWGDRHIRLEVTGAADGALAVAAEAVEAAAAAAEEEAAGFKGREAVAGG
jgi:hypothetical protein